jgi:hypothetical protein
MQFKLAGVSKIELFVDQMKRSPWKAWLKKSAPNFSRTMWQCGKNHAFIMDEAGSMGIAPLLRMKNNGIP